MSHLPCSFAVVVVVVVLVAVVNHECVVLNATTSTGTLVVDSKQHSAAVRHRLLASHQLSPSPCVTLLGTTTAVTVTITTTTTTTTITLSHASGATARHTGCCSDISVSFVFKSLTTAFTISAVGSAPADGVAETSRNIACLSPKKLTR